jgi:cytochrome c oxidase subunit 2
VLTGCGYKSNQSPLDPIGPVAKMQSGLLYLSMYFAAGIGTTVAVLLLYMVFKYRAKGNEATNPPQIQGNHKLEVIWTLIPIIILAIVAVPTVRVSFATYKSSDPNALKVRVIGNQWWFAFEYPDLGIATGNELFVPVGKDVQLELTSRDVIHSFWVPKLAGKVDVIPGRVNVMWFNAPEAGYYYGQCAEFCGTSHANMRFRVHALPQAEFDAWVAKMKEGVKEPTDPVAKRGYDLFMGKEKTKANCITCHAINGTPAKGNIGPNLTNLGERTTLAAGLVPNTEENLKKWIKDPKSVKQGVTIMPAHPNLSDEDMKALVTFLESLKTGVKLQVPADAAQAH